MSKNGVLSRPKVSEPTGRSSFDRSFNDSANLPAGLLGVAKVIPCVAGTKGRLNRRCFTRSAQVVHPAFSSVTEHFDFFKVPMRLIMSQWNDMKLNINDSNFSSLIDMDTTTWDPVMVMSNLVPRMDFGRNWVNDLGLTTGDTAGIRRANNLFRLMDMLGYGACDNHVTNVMSLFKLAAYNKVYYDHYRNTAYESNDVFTYNLDWLFTHPQNGGGLMNGLLQLTGQPSTPGSSIFDAVFRRMIEPKFVNYRNDFMHNIYPALNYVISEPNGLSWSLPSDVQQLVGNPRSAISDGHVSVTGSFLVPNTQGSNVNLSQPVTVQNIRAAFALTCLGA